MLKTLPLIAALLWSSVPITSQSLDILSPTNDGVVYGHTARFIINCSSTPEITAKIDTENLDIEWTKMLYGDKWVGDLELPDKGEHAVLLEGTCGDKNTSGEVRFDNRFESTVEIADLVINRFLYMNKAEELDWNWGPAIFLYPLLKIAPKSAAAERYIEYIKKYHQRHLDKGVPRIQWADHCPSALSAFELAVEHGDDFAWSSVEKVMDWIKDVKRNDLGSIDHLGYDNIKSVWFPGSIWVDSLVMWVLITVKHAIFTDDEELLDFGVDQPFIFADKLLNPVTGLFYHAWNIEEDQPYPADNAHWLRGNGWALVAMAEILTLIGDEHKRYDDLAQLFVDLASATLPHRQPSGYWDTVIDKPGYAYEESSGSALVAVAYAKGVRLGLLPKKYRQYAEETFHAITARMTRRGEEEDKFFTMEEISKGTNPLNALRYKMIGKDRNISYGVGAFLLLADELAGADSDPDHPATQDDAGVDGSPDSDPDSDSTDYVDSEPNHGVDSDDIDTDFEPLEDGSPPDFSSSSGSCQCTHVPEQEADHLYSLINALF